MVQELGPTPMYLRRDGLAASSKMIISIENIAIKIGVTAMVGRLSLSPNVTNAFQGKLNFC